ncbi:Holliday junction branch migration protein RuvA [Virgibacillus sp. YIM 98842]|uniref:Holliday junction branch migration protein RuvA n=1 Tax=Virgibacillus sp. YIM 98842 TaxID=2663533 RepID=UPI0013DC3657|nr:Holliday junction branch migration protein RuvA [Virgibacillus sp. YIM 98842]
MIAYIKGNLSTIQDDAVIVDVQGVGYEVICPNPFVFQSHLNQELLIYTYHYVREDQQLLYGFKNRDEKYLFTKLISVSGIGPKGALAILGSVDIQDFAAAVEQEDEKYLTGFPGVGKKTARQIILDLKGKLTSEISISGEGSGKKEISEKMNSGLQEAQEALLSLGYTDREIKAVLPELRKLENAKTDEIIRTALSLLMKN